MKRNLLNIDVWIWKYDENQRNFPGVILMATPSGVKKLVHIVDTLIAEGPPSEYTIPLRPTTRTQTDRIVERISAFTSYACLVIELTHSDDNHRPGHIGAEGDCLCATFTPDGIRLFRESLFEYQEGATDFAFGTKVKRSLSIWFF